MNIQDKDGNCINDKNDVLTRWTEYCSNLYYYNSKKDTLILNATEPTYVDNYQILRGEVEAVIWSLKNGKSPRMDNLTRELLKYISENMSTLITDICI